jgi:hypothetical protein
MTFSEFYSTFPLFVVALAAATSLISFRNNYPDALKKMSVLWVINFCVDLTGHIIKHNGGKNHWLYNILFWIMCMALAYLYDRQIQNKKVHSSIRWFYMLFPLLIVAESIVVGIKDLQPIIIVSGGIFMIFLAACYFRQLYLSDESEKITRDPWFWFSFGFIIHFGNTTPFLGMLNYLWARYPEFTSFYYLYFCNSFTILLNILIITGFLCRINYQQKLR